MSVIPPGEPPSLENRMSEVPSSEVRLSEPRESSSAMILPKSENVESSPNLTSAASPTQATNLPFPPKILCLILACMTISVFAVTFIIFTYQSGDLGSWVDGWNSKNPAYGIVLFILIALSVLPFFTGTLPLILVCAWKYKWWAFIPVYLGVILGNILTFVISRNLRRRGIISLSAIISLTPRQHRKYIVAIDRAISTHGFWAIVLLQLSALPTGICNVALALTDVKLSRFAAGTALTRIRLIGTVALGIAINSVADFVRYSKEFSFSKGWQLILTCVTIVFTIALGIFLTYYSKKTLDRIQDELDAEHNARPHARSFTLSAVLVKDDDPAAIEFDRKEKERERKEKERRERRERRRKRKEEEKMKAESQTVASEVQVVEVKKEEVKEPVIKEQEPQVIEESEVQT